VNQENRRLNAEDELASATEALGEAEILFREVKLRGAISRGYYSLFHAVRALLFSRGLEARTHDGVETLFHLHFIRANDVTPEWGVLFARLQGYRERADYGPALVLSPTEVREELDRVARFLELVRGRVA
jgi:hypothetical protein